MNKEIDRYTKLEDLVQYLPKDRRSVVIALAGKGLGLLEGAGFGHGMLASFWNDCVTGEIRNYLKRTGKLKEDSYANTIHDFYIDTRVGRAPRGKLRELQNELALAINTDQKACSMCGKATAQTIQQQHESRIGKQGERKEWILSQKRMQNRNLKSSDPSCYFCYQNKLVTHPKEKKREEAMA